MEVRVRLRLISTDHILQGGHSLAQKVVSNTPDVLLVLNHCPQPLLEHTQVIEEVALTTPEVISEAEAG